MMSVKKQIKNYIAEQSEIKRIDMLELHRLILKTNPRSKLWFLDGKNDNGKVVSNPSVGYGFQAITLAGGKTREFYQIGFSANQSGISVYIMGLSNRTSLPKKFSKKIGKATVTGYCIKFKTLKDINVEVLEAAIRYGFDNT